MNKKSKIVTIVLLIMTVFLMGAIFYIGYVLTSNSDKASTTIAPQQTKAQSGGFSKYIAFTLTPTEIVLAYQNPTPTLSATISATVTPRTTVTATVSATITPTKVARLPQTGFITNTIILFGVSALVMFISFIF